MKQNNLRKYKNLFVKKLKRYIKKNDTIYIESDLSKFTNIFDIKIDKKTFITFYFEIFNSLVGKNGTIICPAFTYSWGKDKKKKIFDIKKTSSRTGILSEFMRLKKRVKRTLDPMFSFLIFGKQRQFFFKIGNDSFGKKSVFEKMHKQNVKLISFGLNKFDPTFVHYVEQYFDENFKKIKYRKKIKFKGILINKNKKIKKSHYAFMRNLKSNRIYSGANIKRNLKKKKQIQEINIKNGLIQITTCSNFFETGILGMKKNINFFNKKLDR